MTFNYSTQILTQGSANPSANAPSRPRPAQTLDTAPGDVREEIKIRACEMECMTHAELNARASAEFFTWLRGRLRSIKDREAQRAGGMLR